MATGYDDAASASGEPDGPAYGLGVSRQGELLELPLFERDDLRISGFLGRAVVYHGWAEAGVSVYEPGIGDWPGEGY